MRWKRLVSFVNGDSVINFPYAGFFQSVVLSQAGLTVVRTEPENDGREATQAKGLGGLLLDWGGTTWYNFEHKNNTY